MYLGLVFDDVNVVSLGIMFMELLIYGGKESKRGEVCFDFNISYRETGFFWGILGICLKYFIFLIFVLVIIVRF